MPAEPMGGGAFYRKPELKLSEIEPAKRDLAYLHHQAQKYGLTPSEDEE